MGLEVKTSADVKRTDNIEGLAQVSTIPDALTKPVGAVIGPFAVVSGQGVAKIVGKTPADGSDLPGQTAVIRDSLRQQKTRDRATLFADGLKKRLQDQGKLEDTSGRHHPSRAELQHARLSPPQTHMHAGITCTK